MNSAVGVVIIGRNEGERLVRCLDAVRTYAAAAVYVDSGSTDGSVSAAEDRQFRVVKLDMRTPFTAARARNAGSARVLELFPSPEFIFFVDGDCEVNPAWIDTASAFLAKHPDIAAVFGRLRERYPERSLYNMLCDMEWSTFRPGETKVCGGNVLMRASAFAAAGGYRDELICGEEPELCVRLRKAGWRIWCLDVEMAVHDAAMYHFGQWWSRMMRGGYAFALGVALHGRPPERHSLREYRSAWTWGLGVPLAILILTAIFGAWMLVLLLLYPLQVVRLAVRDGPSRSANWWRAGALVLGKFPEMLGQLRHLTDRSGRRTQLIEYK